MQCRTCGATLSTTNQTCTECGSPVITLQQVPAIKTRTKASSHLTQRLESPLSYPSTESLPNTTNPDRPQPIKSIRLKKASGLLTGIFAGILIFVALGVVCFLVLPSSPQTPSGQPINSTAATLITHITTAGSVNLLTAEPGPPSQTFKKNTTIYVTFRLNSKLFDFHTYKTRYVQAKFYLEKTFVYQQTLVFSQQRNGGFFAVQYNQPASGSVELYSCLKSDCSDGKLAQMASFTINP